VAAVGCAGDDEASCVEGCQDARAMCPSETDALAACTAAQPTSDFQCDADFDEAELTTSACDSQLSALLACIL
jgi:hypothetical protein